ncbi:uncharacterized protein LOC135468663 isoform X1 [Liolophura sinensis]|uniref:uncharacterized protein LOC135468663 isoform X1 n=1 Tax=Liolophura sinensis TaxID=3198878 RepID=UPI0031581162
MKLVICLALFVAINASVIRRETQTDLGAQVEAELKQVLSQIETTVDQGKAVAHDLLTKGHTLLEQAKTLGGQVWHTAQGELAKLNTAAASVFGGWLKNISNLWHELQHVIGKRSAERRFLLDDIKAFNARLSKDMQALFHDIGTHLRDFNEYIGNVFKEQVHNAQPIIDNVKGLAENFLNATAAKSQEVVKQAQTFFEPYKHDLGELWTEIECEYQHVAHSGPACSKTQRREAADLHAEIKKVLGDIESTVAAGGKVAHDLLNKGKTLLEQAKTVGGKVWENSKGELAKLEGEAATIVSGFLKGVSHLWSEIHSAFGKRETQTGIGSQLEAELKTVLKQIETTVDEGKQVAHDLLEKGHTLLAQAKVTGGQVWQNAKGELAKLNDAASTIFSNFLKTASSFWHEIVNSFGKRETQTAIGAQLEAELKEVLKQIETTVDDGKQVAHHLLEKGHTLLAQAKVTGGQVWQNAKGELAKLNGAASTIFSNFLKTASSFWHEIVNSFGKRDAELEKRFLLDSLKELSVHLSEDLNKIFTNVGSKFHAFNAYLVDLFKQGTTAAKPVVDNVKTLAHNFLTATQAKSKEVVSQAKEFFEPYKHDLGQLWSQVECTYNHVVHNAAADCHDAPVY